MLTRSGFKTTSTEKRRYALMKKLTVAMLGIFLIMVFTNSAMGENYRIGLHAGGSSVHGGFDIKNQLGTGYYRIAVDGVYSDDDDEKYSLFGTGITLGSETLMSGLQCDLGFKALLGNVEDHDLDGNMGAITFFGQAFYTLPMDVSSIPIRFSALLAGAPSPLCFMDCDQYTEFKLDGSVFIVEYAAIVISYRHHNFHMEEGSTEWKLKDDAFTIGLELNF